VRHSGYRSRGQEGTGNPDDDDGDGSGPEASPADMHPAVKEDAQQRDGDDAFDGELRRRVQAGQDGRS
jgi:hypothetical protein